MMRWLLFWWYVLPLLVRHQLGRWYVFRDSPQWVLEEVVADVQDDGSSADTSSFLREAQEELGRRKTWKR